MKLVSCRSNSRRNPLSLDMGWKVTFVVESLFLIVSQSAFAGYGLKRNIPMLNNIVLVVAIRFRWIWVEKWSRKSVWTSTFWSQSAFAGYGLKRESNTVAEPFLFGRNPLSLDMGWKGSIVTLHYNDGSVAIRFRWIWVEKSERNIPQHLRVSRNPLSLDMGWKEWAT